MNSTNEWKVRIRRVILLEWLQASMSHELAVFRIILEFVWIISIQQQKRQDWPISGTTQIYAGAHTAALLRHQNYHERIKFFLSLEVVFLIHTSNADWLRTPSQTFSKNVMAHGDKLEGKWRGNSRMQWVASTFHATSEHGVSSTTTADAHTSAAGSQYPSHYLGTWCIQHYYRWCAHLSCR